MSFKKPVIPVLQPKEGYNRLKKKYADYHKHLDSFDKWTFKRMLPRSLQGLAILDIGAGDGRMFKYFKNTNFARFVAADVSEELLKRHPWIQWVETVLCDLDQTLPFENESFDLVITFFVFEHIQHLRDLFEEVQRIMKPGGVWVVWHFLHRREFPFKDKQWDFKIKHYKRTYSDLEEYAERAFFDHSYIEVFEKNIELGRIYRFEKH